MPVPCGRALCQGESVNEWPFYIMASVEGRVLWDLSVPGLSKSERATIYDEMNRVIK